jgi:uncharacterized protein
MSDSEADLAQQMRSDLADIERMCMPFGKYGPKACPPDGMPIYDLPAEYLSWFAMKAGGFPKGRLGQLLHMVYQMKVDGSDVVFDPMRQRRGGRVPLRPTRQRIYKLDEDKPELPFDRV